MPADLLALPTEILLEVFSHLDFTTLTVTVPLVCRHLREIIKAARSNILTGSLANAFFVAKIPGTTHAPFAKCDFTYHGRPTELHPRLRRFHVRLRRIIGGHGVTDLDDLGLLTSSGSFVPFTQDPSLLDENATNPPFNSMRIRFFHKNGISRDGHTIAPLRRIISSGGAITVLGLTDELFRVFRRAWYRSDVLTPGGGATEQFFEANVRMTYRGPSNMMLALGYPKFHAHVLISITIRKIREFPDGATTAGGEP